MRLSGRPDPPRAKARDLHFLSGPPPRRALRGFDADVIETATVVEYWELGYLPAAGLLDGAEAAAWAEAGARLVADRGAPGGAVDVVQHAPALAAVASDPRILEVVTDLFGHHGELLEASLLRAGPASSAAPLKRVHAECADFGIAPDQMVVAYVGLGLPGEPPGTVALVPGHHRPHPRTGTGVPLDRDGGRADLSRVVVPTLQAGDLLFVHSLTPHRPRPVGSAQPWRPLRLTYVVDPRGGAYDRYRAWRG